MMIHSSAVLVLCFFVFDFVDGTTLSTNSWSWNTGEDGHEWDMYASVDLTITDIAFNFNGCASSSQSFNLYTKSGTHVGSEETSSAWTYVCGGYVSCYGYLDPSSHTSDQSNCDVDISAGTTQGFYLQGASRGILAKSTSGTVGDVLVSDSNLIVYLGTGMYDDWYSYGSAFEQTMEISYSLTAAPTNKPTVDPTPKPTNKPSINPTDMPSREPTPQPTDRPTNNPTNRPTNDPTNEPTDKPTINPTNIPTNKPSVNPTNNPSDSPSDVPSDMPSSIPSNNPTDKPSVNPTVYPTRSPSVVPSDSPTKQPSLEPSGQPSKQPSKQPSDTPSKAPSDVPSENPTIEPTEYDPTTTVEDGNDGGTDGGGDEDEDDDDDSNNDSEESYDATLSIRLTSNRYDADTMNSNSHLQDNIMDSLKSAAIEVRFDIKDETDMICEIDTIEDSSNSDGDSDTQRTSAANSYESTIEVTIEFETERILEGFVFDIDHIMTQWEYHLSDLWNVSNNTDESFGVSLSSYDASAITVSDSGSSNSHATSEDYATLTMYYNYALGSLVGFFILLTIAGQIDAKFVRANEQFHWIKILIVGLYTMDVVSDLFFILQVWYQGICDTTLSPFVDIVNFIIFGSAIVFLFLPIICNVFQLHQEIKEWLRDPDTRHIVAPFIDQHLRALYFMSIVTGSSFSTVELCHSNLFSLKMFDMGLNSRQRSLFKNKRIFSVVALENLPQLILQVLYTIVLGQWTIITIFSAMFSIISILLSLFEFISKSLLLDSESVLVIKMPVKSEEIGSMDQSTFRGLSRLRKNIEYEFSKILQINVRSIELLRPTQLRHGVNLTIHIRSESSKYASILNTITQEVESGHISNILMNEWSQLGVLITNNPIIDISTLETKELHAELNFSNNRRSTVSDNFAATIKLNKTTASREKHAVERLRQNTDSTLNGDGVMPTTAKLALVSSASMNDDGNDGNEDDDNAVFDYVSNHKRTSQGNNNNNGDNSDNNKSALNARSLSSALYVNYEANEGTGGSGHGMTNGTSSNGMAPALPGKSGNGTQSIDVIGNEGEGNEENETGAVELGRIETRGGNNGSMAPSIGNINFEDDLSSDEDDNDNNNGDAIVSIRNVAKQQSMDGEAKQKSGKDDEADVEELFV